MSKNIPKHVAIIMDGNRRWAREKGLSTIQGHKQGYTKMKEIPKYFTDQGVEIVSVYAFSTENWNRDKKEVDYLMNLLREALSNLDDFHKKGYRLLVSGRLDDLPGDLGQVCARAVEETQNNKKGILNICLNYGGRAELIDAMQNIIQKEIPAEDLSEKIIQKNLYYPELSDPDIIIRTSGEKRLSGFLLWQSAYSELFFIDKNWPDFSTEDAQGVLDEYAEQRKRRFGGN